MNCDALGRCLHCGSTCTTGGCPNFNCPSRKFNSEYMVPSGKPTFDDLEREVAHLRSQIDGLSMTIQTVCPNEIGKFTSEGACEIASRIIARVYGAADARVQRAG